MPDIKHVFVLMLENRSFDHMLGFSGISGVDAATGNQTKVNGLTGTESNAHDAIRYTVAKPASATIRPDPGHEFPDVLEQLCGATATYDPQTGYPAITNSGFVSNFARKPLSTPGDVMQCFDPAQLPVLTTLAKEFAVCTSWFCSMPGPTWPNRFFALAGSSAGLDHTPNVPQTFYWHSFGGFKFKNGTIFDRNIRWRIYSGNLTRTFAHALKGIHIHNIRRYRNFERDVKNTKPYDAQFTWIEPDYGNIVGDFMNGSSQHPLDDFKRGEYLIKNTYEALRASPVWDSSLLIITWDEHGGFYDHVEPPAAVPHNDQPWDKSYNRYRFDFTRYGPRVPTVIISPLIARNLVDHRIYDHTSILATVETLFNLQPLTSRDGQANDLACLMTESPRTRLPVHLPEVPQSGESSRDQTLDSLDIEMPEATRGDDPVEEEPNNLPGFLYLATRAYLQIFPTESDSILLQSKSVRTRRDARNFIEKVRQIIVTDRRRTTTQ